MNIHQRLTRYWISSLISGASNLIGGVVNEYAADKRAQLNREAQKEENQRNRDWQEMMYNKYESPAAQQQQMLAAGLNPMGAVSPQSVGSASTSSLPTNDGPGAGAGFGAAITGGYAGYIQGKQLAMQMKALNLANQSSEEDIKTKQLNNQMLAIEAGNYQEYYNTTLDMLKNDSEFKKLSKKEQELKIEQMYEAAKNGWNPFENEQRAADDAHELSSLEISIKTIAKEVEEETKKYQIESRKSQTELIKEDLAVLKETHVDRVSLAKANSALATNQSNIAANEVDYRNYISNFIDLLGFDPRTLPPALQAHILHNYTVLADRTEKYGSISKSEYQEFLNDVHNLLYDYIYNEAHVPQSESDSFSLNAFGVGASSSKSSSW